MRVFWVAVLTCLIASPSFAGIKIERFPNLRTENNIEIDRDYLYQNHTNQARCKANNPPSGGSLRWRLEAGSDAGLSIGATSGDIIVDWGNAEVPKFRPGHHEPIVMRAKVTAYDLRNGLNRDTIEREIELVYNVRRHVDNDGRVYGSADNDDPDIAKNLRNLTLDVFFFSADSGNGYSPNSAIYNATLYELAQGLLARAKDIDHADARLGGTLAPGTAPDKIVGGLNELIRIFKSPGMGCTDSSGTVTPNVHPLYCRPVKDYYMYPLLDDAPTNASTMEVWRALKSLVDGGIEIPFMGDEVDRAACRALFNNPNFLASGADGIGDLVEHEYYTMKRDDATASRRDYINRAREAGIIKMKGEVPHWGQHPGAIDHQSTSKSNDECCNEMNQCEEHNGSLCSMFEGSCSLSSDYCE